MNFFVQLWEAIAFLIPDLLTLGLVAPAFLSLYCIAKSLDLAGTVDTNSALGISLALGYLVGVALNTMSSLLVPARSRITTSSRSKERIEQLESQSPSGTLKAPPIEHGGAFIES